MEKLYFCAECGILTDVDVLGPKPTDVCSNCNNKLYDGVIVGNFTLLDAKALREAGLQ